MTTKPIPATWPQQKALWAIFRKVAKGDPSNYKVCDFAFIKKQADDGVLTKERAHTLISHFYNRDYHTFRGGTWATFEGPTGQMNTACYDADHDKFMAAVRRPRHPAPTKFTYDEDDKENDNKSQEDPSSGNPKAGARPSMPGKEWFPALGDRVQYRAGEYGWLEGNIGIVKKILDRAEPNSEKYGVDWEYQLPSGKGHDLGGELTSPTGWYVRARHLNPYRKQEETVPNDIPDADDEFSSSPSKGKPDSSGTEEKKAEEKTEEKAKQEKFKPVSKDYEKPSIFDDVCLMVKNGVQVLLVGPSGCGKSMMITEIQKVLERDLYVESFAGGKRYAQVFGSTHLKDGQSQWQTAEFLKAVQKPGIVFMDEVMSADADVLIGCNSLLDIKTRCFHTPEGVVNVHPECTIVGASNVSGREYSQNYKGTQQQDASILNRFVHVPMTYDKKVEQKIVDKAGLSKEDGENLIAWLNSLRTKININNIQYDPSTRKLVQAIGLVKMGMPAKKAFTYAFLTPLSEIEKKKVGDIC